MLEEWRKFNLKLIEANPAPYDETPEFRKFMMWFPLVSAAVYISASYFTTIFFAPNLASVSRFLEMQVPILRNRISYLGGVDSLSVSAFSATILASLALTPFVLLIHWRAYWRSGIKERGYKAVDKYSAIAFLRVLLIFLIFAWIAFVDTPMSAGKARVGMAGIFFWPIFPFFGSLILWVAEGLLFVGLVGLVKARQSYRRGQ